jgi:biofilm PGA synthesis N-glycosyltransferase PgaC
LTWKILNAGFRVGYCENAFVFTNCPNSLKQFIRQRLRWSRGLIEAFKLNPSLLIKPRLTLIFIWWNALFPLIDLTFTFAFIPGVILALFGNFAVVGPMTLALIPLSLLLNYSMLHAERAIFREANIKIRKNIGGMLMYMFAYGFVLQPACVWGYLAEVLNLRKSWGTK